ncbi:MAG: hypothetical protein AAB584_02150 [Patescibacteria group bacterium]
MKRTDDIKLFLIKSGLVSEVIGDLKIRQNARFLLTTWAHNKPKDYLAFYILVVKLLENRFGIKCSLKIIINDTLPKIIEERTDKEQEKISELYSYFFKQLGFNDFEIFSKHKRYELSFRKFLSWSKNLNLVIFLKRYLPESRIINMSSSSGTLIKEIYHLFSEINIYAISNAEMVLGGIGSWGSVIAYKEMSPKLKLPKRTFILLPKSKNFFEETSKLKSLGDKDYKNICSQIEEAIKLMREKNY